MERERKVKETDEGVFPCSMLPFFVNIVMSCPEAYGREHVFDVVLLCDASLPLHSRAPKMFEKKQWCVNKLKSSLRSTSHEFCLDTQR